MTGPRPKANGHKSADEDFTWSCGFCFFERRKKSTIKAHLIQKVCQKTVDHKKSKADSVAKRLMKRNHSCSELEADRFYFSWKDSLSVWERRCVLEIPNSTNLWFLERFRCFQLILRKEKNQYSTDLPLCCFLTLEFGKMLYNIFSTGNVCQYGYIGLLYDLRLHSLVRLVLKEAPTIESVFY